MTFLLSPGIRIGLAMITTFDSLAVIHYDRWFTFVLNFLRAVRDSNIVFLACVGHLQVLYKLKTEIIWHLNIKFGFIGDLFSFLIVSHLCGCWFCFTGFVILENAAMKASCGHFI